MLYGEIPPGQAGKTPAQHMISMARLQAAGGVRDLEEFPLRSYPAEFQEVRVSTRAVGQTGIPRTSRGIPQAETNPELQPYLARGFRDDPGVYEEMMRSDGTVAGMIALITRELTRATWTVELPTDPTPLEVRAGQLYARFLGLDGTQGWIVGGWKRHLRSAILSLAYGVAPFEVLWRTETWKGQTVQIPGDLRWRQPRSIWGWLWSPSNTDKLAGLLQTVPWVRNNGKNTGIDYSAWDDCSCSALGQRVVTIAANRLLLYSHSSAEGNPEGVSIYRPAWIWYRTKRDTILRHQMAADRLASGITVLEELLGKNDQPLPQPSERNLQDFARDWISFGAGDLDWLYQPPGFKLRFEQPGFNLPTPEDLLRYCDDQMRVVFASQLLSLGSASGSLAGSLGQLFYNSLESIAQWIAEIFDGQYRVQTTGIRDRLLAANFTLPDDFRPPRLKPVGIRNQDSRQLIDALTKGLQFRLLNYSPDLEQMARKMLDAPLLTEAEMDQRAELAKALIEGQVAPNVAPEVSEEEPGDEDETEAPQGPRQSEEGTQAPKEGPNQERVQDPEGFE
jgi:hypothetical protein